MASALQFLDTNTMDSAPSQRKRKRSLTSSSDDETEQGDESHAEPRNKRRLTENIAERLLALNLDAAAHPNPRFVFAPSSPDSSPLNFPSSTNRY